MAENVLRPYQPAPLNGPTLWLLVGLPERGRTLHEMISRGVTLDLFERLREITELDERTLARHLRISRTTFARRKAIGNFSPEESDRFYQLVKVINAAIELFDGDVKAATRWLEESAPGLSGKVPVEMLGSMAGTESVLDLISRLEHGVIV